MRLLRVLRFYSGLLKYGNSIYPFEDTTKLEILQASLLYRPTTAYTILILLINLNQAKHYIYLYHNITIMAMGGLAITVFDVLVNRNGVDTKKIFANMICTPQGLRLLASAYPDVKIVTALVNQDLNDKKFIVPGLGDYA